MLPCSHVTRSHSFKNEELYYRFTRRMSGLEPTAEELLIVREMRKVGPILCCLSPFPCPLFLDSVRCLNRLFVWDCSPFPLLYSVCARRCVSSACCSGAAESLRSNSLFVRVWQTLDLKVHSLKGESTSLFGMSLKLTFQKGVADLKDDQGKCQASPRPGWTDRLSCCAVVPLVLCFTGIEACRFLLDQRIASR